MREILIVSAVAASTMAAPLAAQPDAASDRVLKRFADCREVADATARLSCFDKAASDFETAVRNKDVRIIDRGDVKAAKRSLFGFTLPKIDLFGTDRDDDPDAFTEINSTIAFARTVENNRVQIGLADDSNAVWQTTDPLRWPPKRGAKIRIRQGTLGNYFMLIDGVRARGTRVR